MAESPSLQWQYDEEHDVNDGKPWPETDLEDLTLALKDGGTIEGAAHFLGRWGTREGGRFMPMRLEPRGIAPRL
jgi:hypothetical protein